LNAPGGPRARAVLVHLYTGSGVVLAFLATAEICSPAPEAREVFGLLAGAVLIDATDGTLARRWEVKRWLPVIDGRTIDDLVDYLTYTFVPMLLIWRMGWLPEPGIVWVVPVLLASLFGFANTGAKNERAGFFLGFPSYWNVVAFYAGLAHRYYGPWVNAISLVVLALLTVLPVRFLYPNLAPHPWRAPLIVGALIWLGVIVIILPQYSTAPAWLAWLSLVYPLLYFWLSFRLSGEASTQRSPRSSGTNLTGTR
jgi:phosphatidylcholine synthase